MATKSRRPKARPAKPNAVLQQRLEQKRLLLRATRLQREIIALSKRVISNHERVDQALADLVDWTIHRRTGVRPTIEPNEHESAEV